MNVLIELVKRNDGKLQLTHKGVESLLECHSCGICKSMYCDSNKLCRCRVHGNIADKWLVSKQNYGCSDFVNKENEDANKLMYAYK